MLPLYIHLLPAKSFGQIFVDTHKKGSLPPPTDGDLQAIADALKNQPTEKLIPAVDSLLERARQNYENADWSNLVRDIRDALASGASNAAIEEYIRWRIDHREWFAAPKPDDYGRYPGRLEQADPERARELDKHAQEVPKELKPSWLYLRGALEFRTTDRERAGQWFARIWKEFPQSARAEPALFMDARCLLSHAEADWSKMVKADASGEEREQAFKAAEANNRAKDDAAEERFGAYLKKYPQGQYAGDCYGWLGALEYRKGNMPAALGNYIEQLNMPDHPELAKSALFMCEKILDGSRDEKLFRIAAQNPVVAMGTTYLALNTMLGAGASEANQDNPTGPLAESAKTKRWRATILPQLAKAVTENESLYKTSDWSARYLAILAYSASAAGDQASALKICGLATEAEKQCDDLLLAKGVTLQRQGEINEAIGTYRKFLEQYADSPLAKGVQLKLALALIDQHDAGLALLELKELERTAAPLNESDGVYPPGDDQLKITDSTRSPNISNADAGQIAQLIDTLLNFAPLPELDKVLKENAADNAVKEELEEVMIERYLAQEDFAAALHLSKNDPMKAVVSELAELTKAAKGGPNRAEAMEKLGDAWATARGKLLKEPLGSKVRQFNSQPEQADLRRRINGQALGYTQVEEELDAREELAHASDWWAKAAEAAPKTDIAARSLGKMLNAIPQIADASEYSFERTIEKKGGERSRKIHDQLQAEFPESREAHEAAYWSFTTAKETDAEFPSYTRSLGHRTMREIGRMGYESLDYEAFRPTNEYQEYNGSNGPTADYFEKSGTQWSPKDAEAFYQKIEDLKVASQTQPAEKLAAQVADIRDEFKDQIRGFGNEEVSNSLDDLALFLKEPNLSQETLAKYIELRLRFNGLYSRPGYSDRSVTNHEERGIAELLESPSLKAVPDYVDFIKAVQGGRGEEEISTTYKNVDGTTKTFSTSDYGTMEKNMREFLAKYPKSAKREAAALILARSVHWLTTPFINPSYQDEDVIFTFIREPFSAKRVLSALDAYDQEFPQGRYASDIRGWRASALMQMAKWDESLSLTIANLEDSSHPALQPEAALRLANIFGHLRNADERSDLIKALKANSKGIEYLRKYLTKVREHPSHPLRYMEQYLADTLGFELPVRQSATTSNSTD